MCAIENNALVQSRRLCLSCALQLRGCQKTSTYLGIIQIESGEINLTYILFLFLFLFAWYTTICNDVFLSFFVLLDHTVCAWCFIQCLVHHLIEKLGVCWCVFYCLSYGLMNINDITWHVIISFCKL